MKISSKLSLVSLFVLSCCLTSCGEPAPGETTSVDPTTSEESTSDPTSVEPPFEGYDDDYTYYFETKINNEKHLKIFRSYDIEGYKGLNKKQLVIATAIQGFFSREAGEYYFQYSSSDVWLEDLKTTYGFTFSNTTLDEMVQNFKENFTSKYVLYDASQEGQLNVARSIAGIKDMIPVDIEYEEYLKGLGLSLGIDARELSEEDCFNTYKDEFNNNALIQQNWATTQEYLTDYGIAAKHYFFWPADDTDVDVLRFRSNVHSWVKKDAPMFGWVPNDETVDVNIASNYGQFVIPSDWARNMSVFAAKSAFGNILFNNPIKDDTSIKAQTGKHYITIMMSDGDNVQTWYNSFPTNPKYMGAERADFKMGWSIQPSLSDLGRNVLNYIHNTRDENDFYVCSVSGHGYMNPRSFPQDALQSFTKGLSSYLRRTNLSVVQILDSGPSDEVIDEYAKIPELNGGIYCYGDRYAGGNGSVYWANEKPFVAVRETLWNANIDAMVERINSYSTDINSIEAYTAINLHPWSMDYNSVKELVSKLSDHVEVVTADEFIRLVQENVPHEDVVKQI